jgi:hypothetical protein
MDIDRTDRSRRACTVELLGSMVSTLTSNNIASVDVLISHDIKTAGIEVVGMAHENAKAFLLMIQMRENG